MDMAAERTTDGALINLDIGTKLKPINYFRQEEGRRLTGWTCFSTL